MTALPDGTVIGCLPLVDDAGIFPSFLAVPVVTIDISEFEKLVEVQAPRFKYSRAPTLPEVP